MDAGNTAIILDELTSLEKKGDTRKKILEFETILGKIPGATFGDSPDMPLKHTFAEGVYVREIFIPKGFVLTGKIHRHSHPNFLMKGEVMVVTEHGGKEHLKAPLSMISAPGTKRAIVALEDTTWITVHVTTETDLEKIEKYVIAESYDDPVLIEYELEQKNCLILALKEKRRDFDCLLKLPAKENLLPFKTAIETLEKNNISLEGIYAIKTKEGEWHVSAKEGLEIEKIAIDEKDMVGTWAAVAIGGGTLAGTYLVGTQGGGTTSQEQVPLETPEQRAARIRLLDFASTGQLGDFKAGADVGITPGNYGMTGIETQGQSALSQLLNSGIPSQYRMGDQAITGVLNNNPGIPGQFAQGDAAVTGFLSPGNDPTRASQYAMGDTALASLLNADPNAIQAQFDPFKQQVERQIAQSNRDLKRGAGFTGSLYSTNTIRGLGDIQARGNETLTSQLASLTNEALNRRLQAIPLAYQSGAAQENLNANNANRRLSAANSLYSSGSAQAGIAGSNLDRLLTAANSLYDSGATQESIGQSRIAASQQYGGLSRTLGNAGTSEANAEILRRRNELLLPLNALTSVAGQGSNFGVPSVTTQNPNPMLDLLQSLIGAGATYFGSRNTGKTQAPTKPATTLPYSYGNTNNSYA